MRTKIKLCLVMIFAMICTFVGGMYSVESPFTDDRKKIIRLVLKHPEVFRYAKVRRDFLRDTYEDCGNISEDNYRNYDYGDTFTSSEEGCINKVMRVITNGVVSTATLDTANGYATVHLGHASNGFQISAIGGDDLTDKESDTYMSNIAMLLEAIPDNIPTKATLKVVDIAQVAYYDDFASIKYDKDYAVEALAEKGIPYKGQF